MNDDDKESQALGIAFANGVVNSLLLDALIEKGILTSDEVRGLLQRANNGIVHFYETDIGRNAGRAITELLARFSKENT